MKTRVMKKKFRRMLCASMAAIFVMSDMIPVASAQGTAAETLPAPTDIERIVGFEMVNPLNSYEIKTGESLESLDAPEKIRVIVELPEDTKLSTFEEGEAPEQTDDTLPAYEYSHTLEQLSMSSEEDTASSGEETAPSGEDTASSEDSSGTATSEDPSSAQEPSYTEEEIAGIYQESLTKKLGTVNVYALTDNAGASQYRVYGSIEAQAPQWYAIDENGVMLGAVEELDANWDFTGFDSTVAGEHQVKAQLPENYILSEGVEMACLQIVVTQEEEEQSSIENEDGSLPDSLPVSYIQALRAQQPRVSTATFPIKVVREGFGDDDNYTFAGGEITSANVPSIDKYIFKEERSNDGSLISNGARLVVTENGVATAYSNVSGLYNVQQTGDSYKWYYTTVTPENAVAWAVPENAYLELTYIPDPSQPNQFKTIKVQSGNWWDGTVNGVSQNYTIKYPVGTQVSIKVDLPTLYSNFTPNYTGIDASNVQVTTTNATGYATDVGYHGSEYPIYDTATFDFTVPNSDVTIDLKFSSYAKKKGTGELQPTYLRIGQGYPTFWHNGTAYNWSGYKMVRLYEWSGLQNVTMKDNGLPIVNNVSKLPRAYQIYGPDTPPKYGTIGPGTAEPWRKDRWITGPSTKNNPGAAQPNMHKDASVQNGRYPAVNQFNYDASLNGQGGGNYSSRGDAVQSKVQDENGATTLAYVYENTLYTDNTNYGSSDGSASGRTLPVGFMIYTQKSQEGTFVPLETEKELAGTTAINDTTQKVLSTVKVDGMTVKVTRVYYKNIKYSPSLSSSPNGNWKQDWMYLVTVQGATGYLGINFVTVPDTQNMVSITSVSSNIKKADILTTSGGNTSTGRTWYDLGSGGYYMGYQFGDNDRTNFPQFYDGNWTVSYNYENGGVGLRLYRKDGFGIPYLKFNITSNGTQKIVRAGIDDITLNSSTNTGKTTVQYLEANNKKVVEGRAKKINNETVYDFLFGLAESGGIWNGKTAWGKTTLLTIESDPMQIGYQVDLQGGNWSGTDKVIWPYGDNSYVVIPNQTPTKSGTTFRGWKVKLADGTYLKDPSNPNTDLRLQPGQIIPTTDSTYIPLDKLKLDHGVNFASNTGVKGTGYYNTMVLQLEAVYNSTVQEGDIITAPIKVYTQTDAGVNTGANEDYATLSGEYTEQPNLKKPAYAPWKHEYFVNYDDSIPVGNSKYLLNNSLSLVKGIAGETKNSSNEYILGYLRYDKAVNVAYNIDTNGKPDNGPTAPTDNNKYTTVKDNKNIVTLQNLNNVNSFQGWTVEGDNVLIPSTVATVNLDYHNAPDTTTINGTEARLSKSVIQNIYDSGTVRLNAVYNTSFDRISSPNGRSPWNSQIKYEDYRYIYSNNDGSNIELKAEFSYDVDSKTVIEDFWNNKDTVPLTDENIGRHFNWVMYGYNIMTGERSTWIIRDKNVTGETDNIDRIEGIAVDLSLGDDASDNSTGDGRGTATITITIPANSATYETINQQVLYLWAWNDASNAAVDFKPETNYKALIHTDTSGQQTPYTQILKPIFDSGNGFHNNLSGNGGGMSGKGAVASAYWYINVVPRQITQVDTSTGDQVDTSTGDKEQAVTLVNGQATQTLTATFKYDNSIPWNVQNVNTSDSRYAIRIGIYKQNYNSSQWERVVPVNPDGSFGDWATNYEASIISHDEAQGTFTVQLDADTPKNGTSSVLSANYNNYGAKYKIVAYNHANYTGKMNGLLQTDGNLNPVIGTNIPSNTTTVKMNPASMKSIDAGGVPTNDIRDVAFNAPKTTGAKTTIAFRFQGDGASWLNGTGQSNTEMEQLFSAGGGNIIVSLWKRESDTGKFTFVDSFSGNGTLDTPSGNAADTDDYITGVNLDQDTLNVQVQAGTDSNINGTQYRVYAWYVTSNGDNTYNTSTIENAAIFGQANPTTISGTIPYATATVDMKNQAPDYYVTLPSNIILVDSDGNVKEAGTDNDISSQYAGAKAQVSYNTTNTGNIPPDQIPELTVEIENNVKMTSTAGTATDTHTVGAYFTDGYQNVTDGTQSGYVKLGTLSTIKDESGNSNKGQPGQTMPAGTTLPFYLNTKQGNDEEIYTASVTFWFDIMNTAP